MRAAPSRAAIAAAALALTLALVATALASSAGRTQAPRSGAAATAASGAMRVADSRGEGAILSAPALAPGGATTGAVTISNRGASGWLDLRARNVADRPGPGGGVLSRALRVSVQDITGGSQAAVYSGPIAAMPTLRLGLVPAGTHRRYRFTAILPDPGGIDNALSAAAIDFDYSWKLSGARPAHCSVTLTGDRGANRIVGTAGSDRISGGAGADVIKAGAGYDCVSGGRGRDRIDCGPGEDAVRAEPADVTRSCERRF
jgi:hypothetical protein